MKASQRVIVNTISQYVRTIVNVVLTLYTVRLVLSVLGVNDFGIYTIVAGVVSMLSFVTDALVSTTQRFVSYYQGRNIISQLKEVVSNSIFIHIGLGLISIVLFEAIGPVLFNYIIEIPEERIIVAKELYHFVVLMVFVSFVTSPFRALLISHENIVFISIVDIIDGLLKLLFALLLFIIPYDKLVFYGITMLFVRLFNLLTFAIYSYVKYDECVIPKIFYFSIDRIREMFSFAGWNIYSTACLIGRQQGLAIVINRFMGTVANAAYGVGFQLAGNMNFLSVSLANSIRPQIMKAEGAGNRERALWLTSLVCKFSYFLMAAVCVPCMFEIKTILSLWLKDVPEYSDVFCVMVILTILVDSVTGGLGHINQAVGKIRDYCVYMNTPKLFTVIFAWFVFQAGGNIYYIVGIYVVIELLCTWMRVPFVSRTAGLNIKNFVHEVLCKEVVPTITLVSSCVFVYFYLDSQWRFWAMFVLSDLLFAISIMLFGLNKNEREIIVSIIRKKRI